MEDSKRRDRVAKACALCRRKKIKCDGLMPCGHCRHLSTECLYELNKQRKPRAKTADNIHNRISKLEDLMMRIARKVESYDGTLQESLALSISRDDPGDHRGSSSEDQGDGVDDAEMSLELLKASTGLPISKDGSSYFQQCKSIMSETFDESSRHHDRKLAPQYKGAHLGFNMIFSPQSVNFIKLKLQPQDHYITIPMETLLYYVSGWKRLFQSVWIEPQVQTSDKIKKLKTGIFPSDKSIVDDMMKLFYHIHMAVFFCPTSFVEELFEAYYANKTLPQQQRRRFTYSELLVMNLVIAICTAVFIDGKNPLSGGGKNLLFGDTTFPSMEKIPISQLLSLQEEVFMNSIFYYNRISMCSEGIVSVQALLLLAIYLETCWVNSDVNYNVVNLAVRYAQDIGLHRQETSLHLPDRERYQRILIWAICQHMDIEICYRLGKPPLVNIVDVSVLNLFDDLSATDLSELLRYYQDEKILSSPCFRNDMHKYFFKLSQIRSLSYVKLFSASVSFERVRPIQDIVMSINTSLFELALDMPELIRPKFYYEESFDKQLEFLRVDNADDHEYNISNMLLTYFSHLMTINRVPWQVVTEEGDSPPMENSQFRKLSLDSARTILHLARTINRETCPFSTVNWLVHFPFSALINIISNCLNHTNDSEVFKDLSLLIDVSMNFFGYFGEKAEYEPTRLVYMRVQMMDMVVRILLRITIKVIEEGNNMNILGSNPALKEHLEIKYPQLYEKVNDTTSISELVKSICPSNFTMWKVSDGAAQGILNNSPSTSSYLSTPKRVDPTIPNIMHPTNLVDVSGGQKPLDTEWQLFGDDFAFASEEMMNMPNFFFDNGL